MSIRTNSVIGFWLLLGLALILSGCSTSTTRSIKLKNEERHANLKRYARPVIDDCIFNNSSYAKDAAHDGPADHLLGALAQGGHLRVVSDAYYRIFKKLSAKYHLFNKRISPRVSLPYLRQLHKKYSYLPILLPLFKPLLGSNFHEHRNASSHKAYYHKGVDLIGRQSANIYAAGDGTVIFSGRQNGYGKVVIIQHSKDIKTLYAHLSSLNARKGQKVLRGQTIGRQGASGNAQGEHLHFEVLVKDKPVEPMDFIGEFCRIKPRS